MWLGGRVVTLEHCPHRKSSVLFSLKQKFPLSQFELTMGWVIYKQDAFLMVLETKKVKDQGARFNMSGE